MDQIELTPMLLLVVAAAFKFLDFVGNKLYDFIKSKKSFTKKGKTTELLYRLKKLDENSITIQQEEEVRMTENNNSILRNKTITDNIISEVLNGTQVDRFVIFNTHNGNGQPNYYKPYKVSHIQFDTTKRITQNNIKKYDELYVDSVYTKMLIDIQNNNEHKVELIVDDMEDGLLKTIYKKEKINYSEVYFICTTPTGIIYASLSTLKKDIDFSNNRFEIDLAVSRLKSIFIGEKERVLKDKLSSQHNMEKLQKIYDEKTQILEELSQ